ncbi:16897_t:CDS:1, partial [Cetraspora pellucida]
METTFVDKSVLERIIKNYIVNLPKSKQKKALIDIELLDKIKTILINSKDNFLYDKGTRDWAKKRFWLEEITPDNYKVLVKASNKPVLIAEKFHE